MKLLIKLTYAIAVAIIIVFQISCKKENDTFDNFPISISVIDTLGGTKISWSKIESSDFLEYVVVRSNKDSITNFNELNSSGGAFIINRVSNSKQTEFFDFSTNSLVNKLYYRIFVRLKNRTLSSMNYVYNSDLSVLNFALPNEIIQDDYNPNLVYFYSSSTSQVFLYDLAIDSILAKSSPTFGVNRSFLVSKNGANAEIVQLNTSNRRLYFLDAKTLETKASLEFQYYIYNATGSNDGYICVYTEEYPKQFQLVRLSDHKVVSTQSNNIDNSLFYSGTSILKNPNSNSFLLIESSSNPNIARLSYDSQGNFNQSKVLGRIVNNFTSVQPKVSPQGNYYFINGQIFADPIDVSKPINIFLQNFNDFAFKPDGSKCYVLRQNFNNSFINTFEEYSLPSGKISKISNTKIVGRFIIYNNKAYIFGASNTSSQQTILQKIQL